MSRTRSTSKLSRRTNRKPRVPKKRKESSRTETNRIPQQETDVVGKRVTNSFDKTPEHHRCGKRKRLSDGAINSDNLKRTFTDVLYVLGNPQSLYLVDSSDEIDSEEKQRDIEDYCKDVTRLKDSLSNMMDGAIRLNDLAGLNTDDSDEDYSSRNDNEGENFSSLHEGHTDISCQKDTEFCVMENIHSVQPSDAVLPRGMDVLQTCTQDGIEPVTTHREIHIREDQQLLSVGIESGRINIHQLMEDGATGHVQGVGQLQQQEEIGKSSDSQGVDYNQSDHDSIEENKKQSTNAESSYISSFQSSPVNLFSTETSSEQDNIEDSTTIIAADDEQNEENENFGKTTSATDVNELPEYAIYDGDPHHIKGIQANCDDTIGAETACDNETKNILDDSDADKEEQHISSDSVGHYEIAEDELMTNEAETQHCDIASIDNSLPALNISNEDHSSGKQIGACVKSMPEQNNTSNVTMHVHMVSIFFPIALNICRLFH